MARISRLYAVEAEVRGKDPSVRLAARAEKSAALIADLKAWFESRLTQVRGSSPTADAIRYALSRWTGLTRFLDDGRIELDNNAVERAMRPIALNRKNALFAGSDDGAHHWAILATLIECCKLHYVNPQAYLEDILTRLVNGHPQSQIDQLTPWAWRQVGPG
jgi:transposase